MTRNNDRTVILVLLVVFILASGFSACTVGPVGIFASIAQEKDINANRTLAFDGTSPEFVGKLGSTYYTIIGNTVWFRPVTGGPWNKLTTLPDRKSVV